jgi:hypothetical protein
VSVVLFLYVRVLSFARGRDDRGQASAEYALVLLGAAAIALLVVAWATKNDMVGKLLDGVMKHILDSIK